MTLHLLDAEETPIFRLALFTQASQISFDFLGKTFFFVEVNLSSFLVREEVVALLVRDEARERIVVFLVDVGGVVGIVSYVFSDDCNKAKILFWWFDRRLETFLLRIKRTTSSTDRSAISHSHKSLEYASRHGGFDVKNACALALCTAWIASCNVMFVFIERCDFMRVVL